MTTINLKEFQREIHEGNVKKGFWEHPNMAEKICLIHSELSELLEAHRKNPTEPCPKVFPDGTPIGLTLEEEEMADVFIRLMDLAEYRNIDLMQVTLRKDEYNRTRGFKHGKNF